MRSSASTLLPKPKDSPLKDSKNFTKNSKKAKQLSVITANRYSRNDWATDEKQKKTSLAMVHSVVLEKNESILKHHAK